MSDSSPKKQIPLRISQKLWNSLSAWADDEFRSLNGQIEYLLTECVNNRRKNAESPDGRQNGGARAGAGSVPENGQNGGAGAGSGSGSVPEARQDGEAGSGAGSGSVPEAGQDSEAGSGTGALP